MKNQNNTPGPWKYHKSPLSVRKIFTNDSYLIAEHTDTFLVNNHRGDDQADANAKLMAAAPELLQALKSVLAYEERCANKGEPKIGNGILSEIHKAIKKATE